MKNLQSYRLPRLKEDSGQHRQAQSQQQHRPQNVAIADRSSQHRLPHSLHLSRFAPACHSRLVSCLFILSLSLLLLLLQSATRVTCQTSPPQAASPYERDDHGELSSLENSLSATPCKGEWKFPAGCDKRRCDYRASWEFLDDEDEIVFTIATKNRNKWTGIGFSENQAMVETDAILGLVEESGRFFLMDSYLQAYEAPPLDQTQNLGNMTAWRENGVTTLSFTRPRQTDDARDYQFSDNNCPYFIFPVQGGVFNAVNKRIRKHESTPIVSEQRICVRSCQVPTKPAPTTSSTTTMLPSTTTTTFMPAKGAAAGSGANNDDGHVDEETTKTYRIELKFYNLFDSHSRQVNSIAYNELLGSLEENLYKELKHQIDGVRRVEIQEVISEEASTATKAGNTISLAIIDVTIAQQTTTTNNNNNIDDAREAERQSLTMALNSAIQDSLIGDMNVDANYLVIKRDNESRLTSMLNNVFGQWIKFEPDQEKWIIMGAGLSALVLLVLIQGACFCCKRKRRVEPSRLKHDDDFQDEKDNVDKQWKDYYPSMYAGYGLDDFANGYMASGSAKGSIVKNGRGHNGGDSGRGGYHHHSNGNDYHLSAQTLQSLERRPFEAHSREHRRGGGGGGGYNTNYEMTDHRHQHGHHHNHHNHHHHHHPSNNRQTPSSSSSAYQPDFYFMPHQRKYSNDVVRVFVDYDNRE